MKVEKDSLRTVLATDCGSTTTKAVLFQNTAEGWRQTFRGEAPTTVEEPVADVTVGALNSFAEIQEISGRKILSGDTKGAPFVESKGEDKNGIDLYISTSSAGGGLQMIVGGVVREMTAQSAERAALGAGAIVLDTLSADDGREEYEKIERVRHLKPDIVLITGGVDGGTKSHVIEVAEMLLAASPKPRFGDTLRLPVIYAGNKEAREEVERILKPIAHLESVENIRPTLEVENLKPARDLIHDFFLKHVMSHAPGYGRLISWTPVPVMPTPGAVGKMINDFASRRGLNVLAADIGGATTDVFSVFKDPKGEMIFNRTVSANLGMSYSVANVLIEAGTNNIKRWLPFELSNTEINDRLRNKMIRPTSIPQTIEDLYLEQAVCREALRLSLNHHSSLAVGLSGQKQRRGIADIFAQATGHESLINMQQLDLVIGSGGVLSHAPDRRQAALMMLDAYQLEGLTQIAVDSIFMLPHLGVFSTIYPEAAEEILMRDCLINVAHSIAPKFPEKLKNKKVATIKFNSTEIGEIWGGDLDVIGQIAGRSGTLEIIPAASTVDVGAGIGEVLIKNIEVGSVGLILDGRNRPLIFPDTLEDSSSEQQKVYAAMGLKV